MIKPADFEQIYDADPDPFQVADSWYEQRKIAVTMATLQRQRYRHGWDAASGTGHLAAQLADRCDHIMASDSSPTAAALTQELLSSNDSATVGVHTLPNPLPQPPDHLFDLVILSEVLYYLAPADLDRMPELLTALTPAQSEVVATNWRHYPEDAYFSGADAIDRLDHGLTALGWQRSVRHDDRDFLVVGWQRCAGDSR